jgi:hypothetical protein
MRDLRTLQPALVTTHNHLMWFSFAYGFRTNSGSFATLAAIRCASTVEAVNSDTSHVAGNRHTEEKYEHTNRSCNQKTPVWVPRLRSSLGSGGDGGPCAFRAFAQIERWHSGPLLSPAI